MPVHALVAAARNATHTTASVTHAIQHLLSNLDQPLSTLVRRGDRVLVKVNMGCLGVRKPEDRFTTHPVVVEALIRALQDCGARVAFGDDVARAGKNCARIWKTTGMWDVAQRTGATLVDFVAVGAREVRGTLLYPRTYLVSNAYFQAEVIINAANCRSHANIGMSGAIKNMFGVIVGTRKMLIHKLFREDIRQFGRAIADIHSLVKANLSFLDLTSVVEGHGVDEAIRPVGLMLASTDPVALDTVAAQAMGYHELPIWTTYYAHQRGLGCNTIEQINICGIEWASFARARLQYPWLPPAMKVPLYDRLTNLANATIFRPRPAITAERCTGCGECVTRCPVRCIHPSPSGVPQIELSTCADCGCCLKVCEEDAIALEFPRWVTRGRQWFGYATQVFREEGPQPSV